MTKSKKNQKTRKAKSTKNARSTKRTTRTVRARNAQSSDAESIGATWTDVLLGALPILASFLVSEDDDADDHAEHAPLCSVCGRVLELPGADHDRVRTNPINPFPAYRDLGSLFTKAAA